MRNSEVKGHDLICGKGKNELCRVGISRQCCARAEGYGVLLYGNTFTPGEIRIITENGDFAARLPKLFQKAFGVKFDRVPEETNGKGKLIFGITAPEKLEKIINTLGYDARQLTALHVNFGILEEDCCRTAFLRGHFWREAASPIRRSSTIWSWPPVMCRPAGRYRR